MHNFETFSANRAIQVIQWKDCIYRTWFNHYPQVCEWINQFILLMKRDRVKMKPKNLLLPTANNSHHRASTPTTYLNNIQKYLDQFKHYISILCIKLCVCFRRSIGLKGTLNMQHLYLKQNNKFLLLYNFYSLC